MSAHTPGPWYQAAGNEGIIAIDAPPSSTNYDESMEVCLISTQDDNSIFANAALISAAPELLVALMEVLEYIDVANADPVSRWPSAHAVIAKARGVAA